jgi:general secretion pathway protein H
MRGRSVPWEIVIPAKAGIQGRKRHALLPWIPAFARMTAKREITQQGFTLVELMVVLVIIGLMSGAVLLTMSDPRGRLSDDADRFAGRVRAAHDHAIVTARPVALWVSTTGYGFEERRDGRWNPITEKPLDSRDWANGVSAEAGDGGRTRIWFDTIGRADQPMAFTLQRDGQEMPVRVDLDGRVKVGG